MASQFQNRIVGAVVLVALGVIILPGVLDGNKKHYQSEFAAIPIIPLPENNDVLSSLPPATQDLSDPNVPSTPAAVSDAAGQNDAAPLSGGDTQGQNSASATVSGSDAIVTAPTDSAQRKPAKSEAPVGKAYVIQIAALTNAAKVEEIKATLSFANYTVFTIPAVAVQGKATRVFVGPDASRQKLESALPALEKLTGLKGVVKEHKVTN